MGMRRDVLRKSSLLSAYRCIDCQLLHDTLSDIHNLMELQKEEMTSDQLALLKADLTRNCDTIQSWKQHQLRSVHQENARDYVLEQLDDSSVFMILDWAMKWLECKYREKQSDWFGKKGLPWHLIVVIRRHNGRSDQAPTDLSKIFEHRTFCHIFDQCKQDAVAVISILTDVLRRLKIDDPKLQFVYLRSDNGSCYHSAVTTTCIREIFINTGVLIRRIDFSEPQSGKGPCDRRAAVIKGEVRRYINEKHNCTTSDEFVAAAKSTRHLSIFGSELRTAGSSTLSAKTSSKAPKTTWSGISTIFNIQYDCIPATQASSSSNNRTQSKVRSPLIG